MKFLKSPEKILLILIVTLFLSSRLYKITEIPSSVYWDEASIGYNAYSIARTGKDEWGDFLPIHFRAFGEFKLPVYIYSVVPFVKVFGLNEFSVRIPSVLFSLGVVILTYFLAKRLTGNTTIGLWSSFFVTISPWFFIFSRTGFEATAGLMFYLLGILFFLQKKDEKSILFSIISFIFSAYSYNSFRIVSPLTFFILIFLERDSISHVLKNSIHWIVISIAVIILAIWPIYRLYVYDAGFSRLQNVGGAQGINLVRNYVAHFSPHFLFIQGDNNLRHQQKDFGQLYPTEFILIVLGLIYIFKTKTKHKWLPIILILLAPIPASIIKESPHALRSLSVVPFIYIVSAMGVIYLVELLKQRTVIYLGVTIIFLFFFINYFLNFLYIYPTQSLNSWQYGYKKIFTGVDLNDRESLVISDKDAQPYIFALFYLIYDPQKFRDEVVRNTVDKWGFSTVKQFGRFEFGEEK